MQNNVSKIDIGHALKAMKDRKLNDIELRQVLTCRWQPEKKCEFPFSECKRKDKIGKRYINSEHLRNFKWLGVSNLDDPDIKMSDSGGGRGALTGCGGGQKLGKLINKPLVDFSDLTGTTGDLTRHSLSSHHKTSMLKADEFLLRTKPGSLKDVHNLIDNERKKEALRNRSFLKPLVETILLCARQNLALRGHYDNGPICTDGSEPDHNDGNFRALLRYRIRGGDSVLKEHLDTAKQNAKYTSNTIQNELVSISGKLVLESVAKDVNNAQFWSILADETQDRAKREQLVIVVRYITEDKEKDEYYLVEEPIKMLDLIKDIKHNSDTVEDAEVKLSGKAIGNSLVNACKLIGLNLFYLVGQGYDGARAMASERVGVAAILKESAQLADYYHCVMHSLNLSASETSKVREIRHCLDVLREICNFFKYAKRQSYLEQKIKIYADKVNKTRLVSLCLTRFIERHESVLVVKELLQFVYLSLKDMEDWDSYETRKSAHNLLSSIQKPAFLIGLIMLEEISGIMRPVSVSLQSSGKDLVRALAEIKDMQELLEEMRNYDAVKFDEKIFQESLKLASKVNVDKDTLEIKPRTARLSLYRANAGPNEQTAADYYRLNVFYPLLDAVITDIKSRFGAHQKASFLLSKLLPCNLASVTWEEFKPAYNKYSVYLENESTVKGEFHYWQKKFSQYQPIMKNGKKEKPSAIKALNMCRAEMFPNISKLLKILCVLPVSTAEPERFFSKLEKTLTCLRARMGEERLESLIMLQVHRNRTPSVDEVINTFAETSARKLNFLM